MAKLDRKRVLVTGGGSGIGLAIATAFAAEGAILVIAGRSKQRLDQGCAAAGKLAHQIHTRQADVADRSQVNQLVEWTEKQLGGIDILVNNAGVNVLERSLAGLATTDWELMVKVNLNGAFYCTKAVLPGMRARRNGLVINISSVAGVRIS